MDFCGELYCDFIGEMKKRHMDHLIEKILFEFDLDGVRNVRLVSKAWAIAVLDCNMMWNKLIKHSNGHVNLRLLLNEHLKLDFPVPVGDQFYNLKLCNTIFFASEEISRASLKLDFTIDYLPYSFPQYFSMLKRNLNQLGSAWYHFDMNESFIVAMDPINPKMKYWSRRFLTSPPKGIDKIVLEKEVHHEAPGRTFRFSGANLVVGCDYFFDPENIKINPMLILSSIHPAIFTFRLKTNSVFPGSSMDKNQDNRHFTIFDPSLDPRLGLTNFGIHYLTVEGRFLLVVFENLGVSPLLRLFVWEMEEFDSLPWKFLEVPVTQGDYYFMDNEFLVVLNRVNGQQSTFLVYSMLERETGPARVIASIDVDDDEPGDRRSSKLACAVQYKNGFLVIGSRGGDIRFIEVKSSHLIRYIQTGIDFSAPGSLMRSSNSSEFFYLSFTASPPSRGTNFLRFKLCDYITSESSMEPLESFNAFTGEILNFKFDELGIVAVMEKEGRHGIQVLSFLPQCSGCKRISKRIPLKSCSRCKRAKYCSRECQLSNWNHHKVICSKLAVIN